MTSTTPPTGAAGDDEEIFAPILGFPGYFVGDRGTVLSTRRRGLRALRPLIKTNGYVSVNLGTGRHRCAKTLTVHPLVATAFIGPRPPGMLVLHGDGKCVNNDVRNLRWGTAFENIQDAFRHGTMTPAPPRPGRRLGQPKPEPRGPQTHCQQGHALSGHNELLWPSANGKRRCRACYLQGRARIRAQRSASAA